MRPFSAASTSASGGLRFAQTDVVQNAALEQAAVLEHKGDGVHQLFLGEVPHIRSAHPDAAALHIKEPANQVCQCGFAAAGGANESHHLTRLNFQRNALDNIRFAIIAEMHILQGHRGIFRVLRMMLSGTGAASRTESIRANASATTILFSLMYMIWVRVREITGVMMI